MLKTELLIFDRDCAFCQKCIAWGRKKLKYFPPSQGFQELLPSDYGLTSEQLQKSVWFVVNGKKPLPANLAISEILKRQPSYWWRFLGNLAESYWVQPFAKQLYYTVAKNRHKMPGATESCELPNEPK